MNFRVFTFLLITSFSFLQCASQKKGSGAWQKSIIESYYNIWSTGMAPAGTGANFFVKFKKTTKIKVDSFTVNGEKLEFEIKQSDTETLIIGRKYTGPDFENETQEMPAFYKQEKYSGTVIFTVNNQQVTIPISSFESRAPEQQNL